MSPQKFFISPEVLRTQYLVDNMTVKELAKFYGCGISTIDKNLRKNNIFKPKELKTQTRQQAMLEKYGVDSPLKVKEFNTKFKNTCIQRYGVSNPSNNDTVKDKIKEVMLTKYGVTNSMYIKDFKDKIQETKRKNGTFCKSSPENTIFNLISEYYPDVKRQYSDIRYPFPCDFYIPSLDLFIEYQGHWRHGKEPFNPENIEHRRILNKWKQKAKESKYYQIAVRCWTILDSGKRKIARENNLNFLEFFTLNEFLNWYNIKLRKVV